MTDEERRKLLIDILRIVGGVALVVLGVLLLLL